MKLLLTGVAALLLATGTAHANDLLPESYLADGVMTVTSATSPKKFIFVLIILEVIAAVVMI